MIRIRAERRRRAADGLLPMLNIVFLLLVFVILAGVRYAVDPFEVEPPSAGIDAPPAGAPPGAVIVLDRHGRLALDGEPVSRDGLGARMAERAGGRPGTTVWLEADARVPTPRVVEVMEAARAAGMERVVLLTLGNGS